MICLVLLMLMRRRGFRALPNVLVDGSRRRCGSLYRPLGGDQDGCRSHCVPRVRRRRRVQSVGVLHRWMISRLRVVLPWKFPVALPRAPRWRKFPAMLPRAPVGRKIPVELPRAPVGWTIPVRVPRAPRMEEQALLQVTPLCMNLVHALQVGCLVRCFGAQLLMRTLCSALLILQLPVRMGNAMRDGYLGCLRDVCETSVSTRWPARVAMRGKFPVTLPRAPR